ncbi:helix-turn-helix domain-containing protein [Xylophilus sp.]|uniref:helix-turn-helix domain-containing protein n=1 Tax=Xylophilus sp. TaxID=2653893 RepID=UPI0013BC3099|nr:helix-turn-helix domain-containing protein [Xylophilus sp.]KAF1042527.1 MAG: hypothetical protein GAK38_04288 [Xylophilus sp.]
MAKKTAPLLPATDELLRRFGERLRLARQRRRLTARQVAERAGMSLMTLRGLERGGAGVTMGAYLSVMQVLGIERDLDLLGQEDPVGRQLQDARLPSRVKAAPPAAITRESHSPAAQALSMDQLRNLLQGLTGDQLREVLASMPSAAAHVQIDPPSAPARQPPKRARPVTDAQNWIEEGGFASADDLARLIKAPPAPRARKAR